MPCDQCTDPARCENFGVCQQFRHTLPAGSYEQRIKEPMTDDDVFTLVGYATVLRDKGQNEMQAYFLGLALRIADHLGDPELVRRIEGLAAQQMAPASSEAPYKPVSRCLTVGSCSRSIRGLGGCEAGRCERGEGARGVPAAPETPQQQREIEAACERLDAVPPHLRATLPGSGCRALGGVCEWPTTCEERGGCAYGVPGTLPAHLQDGAPSLQCTRCGRKSWDMTERGHACNMVQPFGGRCPGRMRAPGVDVSPEPQQEKRDAP